MSKGSGSAVTCRGRRSFLCFAFAVTACLGWRPCIAADPPPDPPERMLANIEAQTRVADDDPRIAAIRAGLVKADKLYKEDVNRITDLTYHWFKQLQKDGQSVSMAEILGGSLSWQNPAYFKAGVEREFSEYVAVYLTTRVNIAKKQGKAMAHQDTITFMRVVADALTPPPDPPKAKAKPKPRKPIR